MSDPLARPKTSDNPIKRVAILFSVDLLRQRIRLLVPLRLPLPVAEQKSSVSNTDIRPFRNTTEVRRWKKAKTMSFWGKIVWSELVRLRESLSGQPEPTQGKSFRIRNT